MIKYLDIKTVLSALIVAALVSAVGIWGNSKLLDYKFEQLSNEIGILKSEKVDKVFVDQLKFEIVGLKSEKADRALVESRLNELQKGIAEIQGDVKYLVRLRMDGKKSIYGN